MGIARTADGCIDDFTIMMNDEQKGWVQRHQRQKDSES
jgi:hypothetical protein